MGKPFAIGIDPGVHCGIAVYSRRDQKLTLLKTATFWQTVDFVTAQSKEEVEIVVERPSEIRRHVYSRLDRAQHGRDRIAANIGSNRRDAELLIERFEALGYSVRAIAPIRGGKWSQEEFQRYTKWQGRTSQHVRDAARLVWQL